MLLVKEAQEWQRPQTLVRAGGEKGRAASRLPVKDLLVDRVTSKAAQKSLVQQVKRQRRRRLLLVKEIREMGEVDEELIEDIALLTSLANDNCTVEQMHAMARALAHMRPWNVLGVQRATSKEECRTAYRAIGLLLHPDKCNHPQAREAFAKLGDAYAWSKDKMAW